jgi:hypothetical protein
MTDPQKHIEVAISRSAFAHNIRWLLESLAPAKLCVVMKSDAYGHGLSPLLDTTVKAGASYLGICTNTIRRSSNPANCSANPMPIGPILACATRWAISVTASPR